MLGLSGDGTGVSNSIAARAVTKTMHKTIILDRYFPTDCKKYLGFCNGPEMFICQRACELVAKKKSPTNQYVATFSDEYSPGYRRVQMVGKICARVGATKFVICFPQREWLRNLGLKTLNGLTGHFYIKVTPFD